MGGPCFKTSLNMDTKSQRVVGWNGFEGSSGGRTAQVPSAAGPAAGPARQLRALL